MFWRFQDLSLGDLNTPRACDITLRRDNVDAVLDDLHRHQIVSYEALRMFTVADQGEALLNPNDYCVVSQ